MKSLLLIIISLMALNAKAGVHSFEELTKCISNCKIKNTIYVQFRLESFKDDLAFKMGSYKVLLDEKKVSIKDVDLNIEVEISYNSPQTLMSLLSLLKYNNDSLIFSMTSQLGDKGVATKKISVLLFNNLESDKKLGSVININSLKLYPQGALFFYLKNEYPYLGSKSLNDMSVNILKLLSTKANPI